MHESKGSEALIHIKPARQKYLNLKALGVSIGLQIVLMAPIYT